MAIDPDLELQGLIVQTLKADPGVTALVAGRVYDQPPGAQPVFPYITFGPTDSNGEAPDCIDDFAIFVQLDVWSRAVGFPEAKRISDAVRVALADPALTLSENALVFLEHRQTRTFRDPDGLTSHAALSFEASVERRAA
jgi:hypothetical protein